MICVNKSIVQLKTGKTVNVGDIVTEINNINITALSNIEVAELLSSVQLHSIINHSPLEWEHNIRSNRRINNSFNTLNIEHTNRDSVIKLNLQWDYENLCPYCQFLFLKMEKKRDICCNNGIFLGDSSVFPKLNPLPPQIKLLLENRLAHFARNSVSYNNILALGATGVENGSPKGGWEVRFGDLCVVLHGRTYHFMTNSTGQNALRYFLYDAQSDMIEHGNKLNGSNSSGASYERINPIFYS